MVAIYKIENTKTGNCYIGSTKRLFGRWKWHLTQLLNGRHNKEFQKEFDKSDIRDWCFCVLDLVKPEKREEIEKNYFNRFKPTLNGDRNRFVCIIKKEHDVKAIMDDIHHGLTYREIAKKHNVSLGKISYLRKQFESNVFS